MVVPAFSLVQSSIWTVSKGQYGRERGHSQLLVLACVVSSIVELVGGREGG